VQELNLQAISLRPSLAFGGWGGRGPRGKGGVGAPLACPCPGVAPPRLVGREGLGGKQIFSCVA